MSQSEAAQGATENATSTKDLTRDYLLNEPINFI